MDLLDRHPPTPTPPAHSSRRSRSVVRWAAAVLASALFLSVLGWLIADQVQAHEQTTQAHAAFTRTEHTVRSVSRTLRELRHDVEVLATQVGNDHTAFEQDASQLKAAQSELAATQVDVTEQSARITALHTCLGGVEQALNALAVGSRANAISELTSVATACTTASGG